MNSKLADPDIRRNWPRHVGCIAALAAMFGIVTWFVGAVQEAREAARQTQCQGRLNQMHLAFHNYHDAYGCFPPAYVADADGNPIHSWRVLLLPFYDGAHVYEKYRFDEPWNGPNNRLLADQISPWFCCPNSAHGEGSPITDYVVVVGPETLFPGDKCVSLTDIKDGAENTILLVEIADSDIHWMEPRDLNAETMSFTVNDHARPSISAPHPLGPAVVFVDRLSAYRIDASVRPQTLEALTTIAGGENVLKEDLMRTARERGRRGLAE